MPVITTQTGGDFPMYSITYVPSDGPFAGRELTGGHVGTDPKAGRVVFFTRGVGDNAAAFRAAKISAPRVGMKVEGRADLAALADECDRLDAEVMDACQRKREEEERQDDELVAKMEREEAELAALIPAGHVRVKAVRRRDVSALEFDREVDGQRLPWNTPGLAHHGTPCAVRPGAVGAFDARPVYSISRADLEAFLAAQKAKKDEKARQVAERTAQKQQKRQEAIDKAKATGQDQEIDRWNESVDEPDNSLNIVVQYVRPDGTTYTKAYGTY
jgi:hypothetical protein